MRAVWCIVRDRHAGFATAGSRRGKGHDYETLFPGCQRRGTDGTVVQLSKITALVAAQHDAADGQGGVAGIGQYDGSRRTGGVDLLVPEAQTRWTQAHRWCRRGTFS